MKAFDYEQEKGYLKQTDRTKYFLFAMSTVIPFVTGSLGIIPKLFYDLTGKKKERMYDDLLSRRAQVTKDATIGDAESMARASEIQKNVSSNQKL